jgi:hypothetical protein
MKKLRTAGWFVLLVILLVVLVNLAIAQDTPTADEGSVFHGKSPSGEPLGLSVEKIQIELSTNRPHSQLLPAVSVELVPLGGEDGAVDPPGLSAIGEINNVQACSQLLANSAMNVVEFGDGTGTAEPWITIDPIVYFTKDPDFAYDGYSMWLDDGDPGDPSPTRDMLGQGFLMPSNLQEIAVDYLFATLDTNGEDKAYGELWKLDDDWILHLDQEEKYFVGGWAIPESDWAWKEHVVTSSDPDLLNEMSGQKMAIIFFNITDGGGSYFEAVLLDEVYLGVCTKAPSSSKRIFMPVTMNKFGKQTGPICVPPSENPQDEWHSNRGLVQTGSTCNSSLNNVDRADYYTFKPTASGNHTLFLTNLPAGSEWAAMAFFDQASPDYAPGSASDGKCRITQPGSGNKQVVCNFDKNKDYFVKVSAGSTPMSGSYHMRISGP